MRRLFEDFDARLLAAAMPIEDRRSELAHEETGPVERVAARRVLEYSSGRSLARNLLRRMGADHPVVTRTPDRSPRWPTGFVGSIAHCEGRCVAVVGLARDFAAVGIDVEPAQPLEEGLFATILAPVEHEHVMSLDPSARGLEVRRVFVAKEAAYKCLYPQIGVFLDFHDVRIELDDAGRRFSIDVEHPSARGIELEGRFVEQDGWFHALVAARALVRAP